MAAENRLELKVEVSGPAGSSQQERVEAALRYVRHGSLPAGFSFDAIHWRNPDTKSGRSRNWQDGEPGNVLKNSTGGFRNALERSLESMLGFELEEELEERFEEEEELAEVLEEVEEEERVEGPVKRRKKQKAPRRVKPKRKVRWVYRDTKTGYFTSEKTWKRAKVRGSKRYKRQRVKW